MESEGDLTCIAGEDELVVLSYNKGRARLKYAEEVANETEERNMTCKYDEGNAIKDGHMDKGDLTSIGGEDELVVLSYNKGRARLKYAEEVANETEERNMTCKYDEGTAIKDGHMDKGDLTSIGGEDELLVLSYNKGRARLKNAEEVAIETEERNMACKDDEGNITKENHMDKGDPAYIGREDELVVLSYNKGRARLKYAEEVANETEERNMTCKYDEGTAIKDGHMDKGDLTSIGGEDELLVLSYNKGRARLKNAEEVAIETEERNMACKDDEGNITKENHMDKGDPAYIGREEELINFNCKRGRVRFKFEEEIANETEERYMACKGDEVNIINVGTVHKNKGNLTYDELEDLCYKKSRVRFQFVEEKVREVDDMNKASTEHLEDIANNNTISEMEGIHTKEIGHQHAVVASEVLQEKFGLVGMVEASAVVSHREKSQDSGFSDSDCGTIVPKVQDGSTGSSLRRACSSGGSLRRACSSGGSVRRASSSGDSVRRASSSGDSVRRASFSGSSRSSSPFSQDGESRHETFSQMPPPQHSSTPKSKTDYTSVESTISKQWICPVNLWLQEVRYWCDPECMSTLQNKPIVAGSNERVTGTTALAVNAVRNIHHQLRIICERLTILYRRLKNNNLNVSGQFFEKIVRKMEKLLLEHDINISEEFDCSGLLLAFNTLHFTENEIPNLVAILKSVALLFAKNVEHLLLTYIKMLIDLLEHERAPSSLSIVLSGISSLELDVPHLSELLSLCSGISSILLVIVNSNSQAVRTAGLNVLATTCCTPTSIRQLEKSGGLEVLCEILSSDKKSEAEQCGAISLFAQVTGPWLDVTIQGVKHHLDTLIPAITRLIGNNPSTEMLMMCALSLANISSLEVKNVLHLVNWNSVTVLLKAIRILGTKASVFVKEQAATLLANMAAIPGVLPYLRRNRSVPALLCFLQATPSPLHNQRETYATFRLQHKAIIALSRLCSDSDAAKQVVELQGVSRIVRLCKDENERNYNDGVLVACLVALRKIADHCDISVMQSLDASELVEPNLLESFLLYSSNLPK